MKHLFTSEARLQILKLLVETKGNHIGYTREIERLLSKEKRIYIASVRRELANLEDLGLIKSQDEITKRGYRKQWYIHNEKAVKKIGELLDLL